MKHCMVVSLLCGAQLLVAAAFAQSPYYDIKIIAKAGDATEEGDVIEEIRQQVSVNDAGQVAFVATLEGKPGSHLMVVSEDGKSRNLSRSSDGRQFAFPQINDSGSVLARDFISANDSSLKLWNAQSPTEFSLVASTSQFQNIYVPSLANDGSVGFSGRLRPPAGDIGNEFPLQMFVNTSGAQTNISVIDLASADSRPAVSNNGNFVLRSGTADNGFLAYFKRDGGTWTRNNLALTEQGWSSLGSAPGISDSGKVIVFTGSEPQQGSGVWVVVDDPNHRELFRYFRIAGGGSANIGPGISFDSFDDFLDQRIGVSHVEAGRPGLEGDRILITFAGTPVNHAGERARKSPLLDNPALPGVQPLLFDFLPAVWSIEITIGYNLNDLTRSGNLKLSNRTSAFQVVQLGDTLGSAVLADIFLHDPVAHAMRLPTGAARSAVNPSDHRVAFWARSLAGDGLVCVASYLDPDDDGLPDHWERQGGGIDIDRDGAVDLNLNAFGADPMRKDAFVEIDWIANDNPEQVQDLNNDRRWNLGEPFVDRNGDGKANIRSFAPEIEALEEMVELFKNAPVPNPNGSTGIVLHIDAGRNLSQNMGLRNDLFDGGSLIVDPGGEQHVHDIYHEKVPPVAANSREIAFDRPWVSLSMQEVKKRYFGLNSGYARELAFRYVAISDRLFYIDSRNNRKSLLGIAEAISAERAAAGYDPRFLPGNDTIVAFKGKTKTEGGLLTVAQPNPGAPRQVPEPLGYLHAEVIAHELGHIFGLLHGGWDHKTAEDAATPRPNYRSMMNYGYSLHPDRDGVLIRDFSRMDGPGTINDWARLELGFARYLDCIGDSFGFDGRVGQRSDVPPKFTAEPDVEWSIEAIEEAHGPLLTNETLDEPQAGRDQRPPVGVLLSPAPGSSLRQLENLQVELEVEDDQEVHSVTVAFDIDGDGLASREDEVVAANSANGWLVEFSNITGLTGQRQLDVLILDSSYNATELSRTITITPESTLPAVAIKSPSAESNVFLSTVLEIDVMATDNYALDSVAVFFDLNGDGDTNDVGEETAAFATDEADTFRAQFQNLAGAAGRRTIRAVARDAGGNENTAQVSVNVLASGSSGQVLASGNGVMPEQRTWIFGGQRQSQTIDPVIVPGRGTVRFVVTSTPPVRSASQNISRADSTIRDVVFDGESKRLTVTCNDFGSDPAICESSLVVDDGGTLEVTVLGPGQWNTFGEFVGHVQQNYSYEITYEPEDVVPPLISIAAPVAGSNASIGAPLTVSVSAIDTSGIQSVTVNLDRNGDGDFSDSGETLVASDTGGGDFTSAFGALSGSPGARSILAKAVDAAGNESTFQSFVKAGGLGAGGKQTLAQTGGLIAEQPIGYNGRNGRRQSRGFNPIEIPSAGRVTMVVRSTPNVRREVQNIERHDSAIWQIQFNGETINLTPACNSHGSDPAICTSVFDTDGPGTLAGVVLGPATYTVFGEFAGHAPQQYYLDVTFESGPEVMALSPIAGSAGGHDTVTISGGGFKEDAVVLFNGVAAKDIVVVSSTQIRCVTPPGIPGPADVTVLNPDADGQPWNYGSIYGLFGERADGFTYQSPSPGAAGDERLLTTFKGVFDATRITELQRSTSVNFDIPGAGKLRFETWAFLPVLSPIPGIEDPSDFTELNESSHVSSGTSGDGRTFIPQLTSCTPINFAYGPVICESSSVLSATAAGQGTLSIVGPARWSARWKALEVCENLGTPEQHWSTAVWFTPSDPSSGSDYETWRSTQFSPSQLASPAISGPTADPDRDTIPNAVEFVLNGHPLRADDNVPLNPTTVGAGLATYPAVEFSVRNGLGGVNAVLEFSNDLNAWTEIYSITEDPDFESNLVASKTPRIGYTELTIRDTALLAFRKRGAYYRIKVTIGDGPEPGAGVADGSTELTFDIAGATDFMNMNQDYGDRVSALSMGDFSYAGSGMFTPNIEVAYGPEEADPAFWSTGYGDLEKILFEDRDGFGQLNITFTADDGHVAQLIRWDMASYSSAFSVPPIIDRVAVLDGEGNTLWEQVDTPISQSTRTTFDFETAPFEGRILTLRMETGNLNNLSDDIALDNIRFGQRSL